MFMKKYSFQSTVINFNEDEDEGDWQSVMAKCLGARHLAMLPQIPDITMSDAGEPSGIFSSMEDPEIGRDMGSICHANNSPILPKTIIERVPNSPVSSPFPSPYPSPFPSPSPVSRSPSPSPSPQPSHRASRSSLRNSLQTSQTSPRVLNESNRTPLLSTSRQPSRRASRSSLRNSLRPNSSQTSAQPSPRVLNESVRNISPRASPQPSPRVSRSSLKSSRTNSLRITPQRSAQPSPRISNGSIHTPSPAPSPQPSNRASRSTLKASRGDSLRTSPRTSAQPSPRVSNRSIRSPSPQSSTQDIPRTSPERSPQRSLTTSPRASPEPSPRASPEPSPRASPEPTLRASPQPSPRRSFGSTKSNYADKRPKRFLKGKRCQKWRGQHPIYKPLENGCFEVTGLTHAKTPDMKKRKVTKVNKVKKVRQETKKTNNCNLSESFMGRSVSTRSKNEELIKSFENLQWKKSKGSDSIELASLFRDKTNGLASGFFRMNGVCEKPSQKTANYKTIYTLLKGSVAVKIGDDPFMVINEFESVTIPELTAYAIKNISDDESILYFNVHQD